MSTENKPRSRLPWFAVFAFAVLMISGLAGLNEARTTDSQMAPVNSCYTCVNAGSNGYKFMGPAPYDAYNNVTINDSYPILFSTNWTFVTPDNTSGVPAGYKALYTLELTNISIKVSGTYNITPCGQLLQVANMITGFINLNDPTGTFAVGVGQGTYGGTSGTGGSFGGGSLPAPAAPSMYQTFSSGVLSSPTGAGFPCSSTEWEQIGSSINIYSTLHGAQPNIQIFVPACPACGPSYVAYVDPAVDTLVFDIEMYYTCIENYRSEGAIAYGYWD